MFLQCAGCGQSVPGGMANCQFCGASLAMAAPSANAQALAGQRSIGGGKARQYERLELHTPQWIETAFTVCSGIYVFLGALHIVLSFAVARGGSPMTAIIVGVIQISLGIALILRNELVRTHINFFLWVGVAMNGFLTFLFTMAALGAGGLMWMAVIAPATTVVLNLALIWLNNEIGWDLKD